MCFWFGVSAMAGPSALCQPLHCPASCPELHLLGVNPAPPPPTQWAYPGEVIMGLCVLGIWVPYSHLCPCVPVQGQSWHPHDLALLRTTGLPLWAPAELGRDAPYCECRGSLVRPMWQRHTSEQGWDLHCLCQDSACPENPSQVLSPPCLGKPLGLHSLCLSLGPEKGRNSMEHLAQPGRMGCGSNI